MRIISPSILSADFGHLEREIKMLNESAAEWVHIDVMDGHFVPNISFGFPVLECFKKHCTKVIDVHLMITEPQNHVEKFVKAGADIVVFHIEACCDPLSSIKKIKECGAKAGISIKPNTPTNVIESLLPHLDVVLIMSVEPGFGGQKFNPIALNKIKEIKEMRARCGSNTIIEIDGGVNVDNSREIFEAGAEVLVAGSAVFLSADPKATIAELLNA